MKEFKSCAVSFFWVLGKPFEVWSMVYTVYVISLIDFASGKMCSIMFYQDREERVSIFMFSAQFWPVGGSTA